MIHWFIRFGSALTLVLGVVSCGEREGEEGSGRGSEESESRADPTPLPKFSDELVALQVRGEQTEDRWQGGAPRGSHETALEWNGPQETAGVKAAMAGLEPGQDWESEKLSSAAAKQLKAALSGQAGEILGEGFSCSDLRPGGLEKREIRGGFVVRRPVGEISGDAHHRGRTGFETARESLWAAFAAESRLAIKIVGVEVVEDEFTTDAMMELSGAAASEQAALQVTATLQARWSKSDPPTLLELTTLRYEEALAPTAGKFLDATAAVLGGTPHYEGLVQKGTGYWASRITRLGDFSLTGHHGLAVGDVNGDGLEDLYVCEAGSLPNRLYVQNRDGTVRDTSKEAGVDWLEDSRCALLVDLDNDGDQDLVVATIAMIVFATNDGGGKFRMRGGHPGAGYPFSLSAADFDNDGLLDVYACVYSADDSAAGRGFESSSPRPFNDAKNGGGNVLLKNLGAFQFADATKAVGLDQDNRRWSFAAAWEDYDRDGDPDLYVANDFGRNCFYRNESGRFRQVAGELGVEDMASGMSVAWGDYNRDGAADLYVGNMYSSAGNRVSYQRNFAPGEKAPTLAGLQGMARGNTLFAGGGSGAFKDVSEASGAHLGRWAWSSGFADLNNDGWEDLVVANGFLTGRRPDDL